MNLNELQLGSVEFPSEWLPYLALTLFAILWIAATVRAIAAKRIIDDDVKKNITTHKNELESVNQELKRVRDELERVEDRLKNVSFHCDLPIDMQLWSDDKPSQTVRRVVMHVRPRAGRHYANGEKGLSTLAEDYKEIKKDIKKSEPTVTEIARSGPCDLVIVAKVPDDSGDEFPGVLADRVHRFLELKLNRCSLGYTSEGVDDPKLPLSYLSFHAEVACRQKIGVNSYTMSSWLRRAVLSRSMTPSTEFKDYQDIRNVVQGDFNALCNRLDLLFQPKYAIVSDQFELSGAEALIRFKGMSSPLPVLAVIADSGWMSSITLNFIIPRIGSFIGAYDLACKNNKSKEFKVSFNVRPDDLSQIHAQEILDAIGRTGATYNRFEVEILEQGCNARDIVKSVEKLQSYLTTVALDDFGDANSNLDRLLEIKADKVKLDMRIVRQSLSGNLTGFLSNLVKTIDSNDIRLTNVKDGAVSRIIAEGAEDVDQVRGLVSAGVREIQGYYFGKPMSQAEFLDLHRTVPIP